jgi:uncharacterized protein (TIGR00730 family)
MRKFPDPTPPPTTNPAPAPWAVGTKPTFSLCVYCGSRPGAKPEFAEIAQAVGTWIGAHGGQLVYGGGNGGLMGLVAQATLRSGGRVVGIIPQALVKQESANHDCTELHIVDTMHERKRMMAQRADAFLALPGGIGTFEELFEVWTWRQLGYHNKPIGLLNVDHYYDGLLNFLHSTVEQQFLSDRQLDLIRTGTDAMQLLPELIQAAGLVPATELNLI